MTLSNCFCCPSLRLSTCRRPDAYSADVRREWTKSTHMSVTVLRYLFGNSRNPAARTLYNAARPFRVIGGVSDAEVEMLQAARGPLAKVALCTMWLQEFITRYVRVASLVFARERCCHLGVLFVSCELTAYLCSSHRFCFLGNTSRAARELLLLRF